jgi:hypothetical protein
MGRPFAYSLLCHKTHWQAQAAQAVGQLDSVHSAHREGSVTAMQTHPDPAGLPPAVIQPEQAQVPAEWQDFIEAQNHDRQARGLLRVPRALHVDQSAVHVRHHLYNAPEPVRRALRPLLRPVTLSAQLPVLLLMAASTSARRRCAGCRASARPQGHALQHQRLPGSLQPPRRQAGGRGRRAAPRQRPACVSNRRGAHAPARGAGAQAGGAQGLRRVPALPDGCAPRVLGCWPGADTIASWHVS